MFDRSKVYGYTPKEVVEYGGFPKDNLIPVDGDLNDVLTKEEIDRMFPEQMLYLMNIVYKGNPSPNNIKTAVVYKYHFGWTEAEEFYNKRGKPINEYPYSTFSAFGENFQAWTISKNYMLNSDSNLL